MQGRVGYPVRRIGISAWFAGKTTIRCYGRTTIQTIRAPKTLIFYGRHGWISGCGERKCAELLRRHCQLKRPWYAARVGDAAARVGELLCSPIVLPRSSRAGPKKGALGPLS